MALGKNLNKKGKLSGPKEDIEQDILPGPDSEQLEKVTPLEDQEVKEDIVAETKLSNVNRELSESEEALDNTMLVVFPVGNEEYALPIDVVKEVVKTPPIAKIPQVPEYIMGVANIRGNVYAIIDLTERVGLTKTEGESEGETRFSLVIHHDEIKVAVAVNKVPDTIVVGNNEIDQSPGVFNQSAMDETFIKGVVKRDKQMIIVIDILAMIVNGDVENSSTLETSLL